MTNKDKNGNKGGEEKDSDTKLWQQITEDVTPLEGRDEVQNAPVNKKSKNKPRPIIRQDTNTHTPPEARSNETDHKTARRLMRGQIAIDGRIDLHGMTQNQAYDALLSFIPSAYEQGKRCVLVITGKGGWQGGDASMLNREVGVLRQKTPQWLLDPPLSGYVLKIQTARPNHGGEGALYVLLRRQR